MVFWDPEAVSPFLGLGDRLLLFDLGVLIPSLCPEAWAGGHTSQVLDPGSALAGGAMLTLHTAPRPSFLIVLLGVLRIQGQGETFCSNSCTRVCGGQVGRAKLLGLNLLNLKFSPS